MDHGRYRTVAALVAVPQASEMLILTHRSHLAHSKDGLFDADKELMD